jgi:Tfp pilus assembly protein PilN
VIENLNLASQPFRNRTLPWTLAVVIAVVSVAALLFTLSQYRETRARALAVEAQVRELRTERESLKRQAEEVNSMLTEDQRRTLDAAHLILNRKNFSWSRLFADLESTLPQQVRVSRITVRDIAQVGGRTRADLELAVAAKTAPDVTRMMAQMAASGIFAADLLTQTPETRGGGTGVEATLRIRYAPAAGRPAAAPPVEDTAGERAGSSPAAVASAGAEGGSR